MSDLFNELRELPNPVLGWTVSLYFPEFEDFPAMEKHFTTTTNLTLGDGKIYLNLLESCRGRHQKDRGNDYAEFNLKNPNSETYQMFFANGKDYQDILEKCKIIIQECLLIEDDLFEPEKRFTGYIADFGLDDENKLLNFTAYSDMSREGFPLTRIITRERCGVDFNYNGLKSPLVSKCGWQTIQGGNPIKCTRYLKGVNGCEAHNNEHRFFAITGLANTPVQIVPEIDNGTGFDYDSRSRFDYYYN